MIQVASLTLQEKESLVGQMVQVDWYFNPIQDCNGIWIISTQEIDSSIYLQNEWVKSLPLIDWCQPTPPPPPPSGSTMN